MSSNPAQRVKERMQHWMETTGLDQRTFAKALGKTQVWLQKVLRGTNNVTLKDLDIIAKAMRTTACELVRGPEETYELHLSQAELRVIEQLRYQPDLFDALASFMRLAKGRRPIQRDEPAPHKPRITGSK